MLQAFGDAIPDGTVQIVLVMLLFAGLMISSAEVLYRRAGKKRCTCGHIRKLHRTVMNECGQTELRGGLKFRCPCRYFVEAAP